jgi:hypothetical protein
LTLIEFRRGERVPIALEDDSLRVIDGLPDPRTNLSLGNPRDDWK